MNARIRAPQILANAAGHLDRCAAERDSPEGERSMARAVAAFNAMSGHELTERDGNMFMVCLKGARAYATSTGKPDDYEDGASYFALGGESA